MSSPKAAVAKPTRRPKIARPAGAKPSRPATKPARGGASGTSGSAEAKRLAAEMERALTDGRRDMLSTEAVQALMAAVCKTYAAQVEAGEQLLPLPARGGATATDVMVTASGLLKSANLAVFELGMWQSWTGR